MKKLHSLVLAASLSTIGLGAMVVVGDKKVGIDPPQTELKLTEQSAQLQTSLQKAPTVKSVTPEGMVAVKSWPDIVLDSLPQDDGFAYSSMQIEVEKPGSVLSFDWQATASEGNDFQFGVQINGDWVVSEYGYKAMSGSSTYTFNEPGTYTLEVEYWNGMGVADSANCAQLTDIKLCVADPIAPAKQLLDSLDAYPSWKEELAAALAAVEAGGEAEKDSLVQALNSICYNINLTLNHLAFVEQQAEAWTEYVAWKAELDEKIAALKASDAVGREAAREEMVQTYYTIYTVIVECLPLMADKIAVAEAQVAEGVTGEHGEALNEALAAAQAADPATTKSLDYYKAFWNLEKASTVYVALTMDRSEWTFNENQVYTLDGGRQFVIDTTHKLAKFIGLNSSVNYTELEIPSTLYNSTDAYAVVAIGNRNTYSQNTIERVVLPNTIREVGQNAFHYYRTLSSIELPENVEYVGDNAFYRTDNLRNITVHAQTPPVCENNLDSSYGTGKRWQLTVPDGTFHAYRIHTQWGNMLIVPETPVEITVDVATPGELGLLALNEAGYLQEINKIHVSGELNADDWNNLKGMSNLIEVDLSGVLNTSLPAGQFKDKWAITQVQVPAGLQTIGGGAFYRSGIQQIELPGTLQQINGGAFYECTSLQSVVIPDGVSQWGNQEYVTNWGYISNSIFYNCYSLSRANIPTGVTSIPDGTFYNCNLQEVVIPDNIKSIGSNAFYSNDYLTRVHLSEGLTTIGESAFNGCWSLDSLQMPSTLTSLGGWAFANCSSLHAVQLNEGLTDIWGWAFENCHSLEEVILPSSLRKCWQRPFSSCNNLKKIYARSVIPAATNNYCPLSGNDFNSAVLYVPVWSLQEYQLADGWRQFATVETHDYMPENVFINKDFTFALRDTLATDYRPNIYLEWTNTRGQDSYGQDYYEHGNLTINSRSKLPVNQFSMHVSPLAKYTSDENENNRLNGWSSNYITEWNSNSLIVNGEMRAEDVDLMYTFKENRWNFISVPFDVDMKDFVQTDSNTQWVIREYSGANRANGIMDSTWVNVGRDGVLKAGKGYALHLTGGGVDFHVKPLTESVNRQAIFLATDREVALEENLSEFEHNRSWNLIGNPFPCFFDTRFLDFEAPITVWNSYNQNYVAYSPVDDSYILSPGEAFFVQRPVDQEKITFAKEGRQTHMHPRIISEVPAKQTALDATPRTVYNITLTGEQGTDRTRVVINEKAEVGYELNRDAGKFFSTNPNMPQLFTIDGNARFAINERPMAGAEVQLGVYLGQAGEYTLALANGMTGELIVEDRLLGTFTAISAEEGYTFTAEAGTIADRFVLHFAEGNATGIDNAAALVDENAPAYNVGGQAVNAKTFKGIIVQKGRKLIKK